MSEKPCDDPLPALIRDVSELRSRGYREPRILGQGRAIVASVLRPHPVDCDAFEHVALKVFGLEGSAGLPEFERERVALGALHRMLAGTGAEHLFVRFHEAFTDVWGERTLGFIVSEHYPEGSLLRWRMGQQRLPRVHIEQLVHDLANALEVLHAHASDTGLGAHNDIKPENVMVQLGPVGPRARLGDFGTARPPDVHTQSGTPRYAPRDPAESGPARDVYGLALTTAALIRGRGIEFADRVEFGDRLHTRVLAKARDRDAIDAVDARWYEEVTNLLGGATRPHQFRGTAVDLASSLVDCGRGADIRRAKSERRRLWVRRLACVAPLALPAIALAVALSIGRGRWSMPAGSHRLAPDVRVGYRDQTGELAFSAPGGPTRIGALLRLPGRPRAIALWPSAQPGPIVVEGDGWAAYATRDGQRGWLFRLDALAAVRGPGVQFDWPDAPEGRRGICPAARGLVRWAGHRIQWLARTGAGYRVAGEWTYPRPIVDGRPERDGAAVRVRLEGGQSRIRFLP